MNEILSDTKAVLLWLFGTIGTLLGVLGAVALSVLKGHIKRIDKLEAEVVRRAEFDRWCADLETKHRENVGKIDDGFARMEALIQRNHKDSTDGRHDVRNQILTLTEKVGQVQGRLGLDEFGRREG